MATAMATAQTNSHKMYQCLSSRIVAECNGWAGEPQPRGTEVATHVDENQECRDGKGECP